MKCICSIFFFFCLALPAIAAAGDDPVRAAYEAAQAHYKAGENDLACKEFAAIARDYPTHPVAVYAAHLHLDCLNLTKRYEELGRAAADYLKTGRVRDPEFITTATAIVQSVRFKECNQGFAEKAPEEAARCFSDFADAFPKSRHADKALFNAAVAYARAGREASAAQAYRRLVEAYPDSSLSAKALFALGQLQQKAGQHEQAARSFEKLSARYHGTREAADAMLNAAMLYEELNRWDKAQALYDGYLARFARRDPDRGAGIAFHLAEALEKRGARAKAADHYRGFIEGHAKHAPLLLRLRARLRMVKLRQYKVSEAKRMQARADLERIEKLYRANLPQQPDPALLAVVAEAAFLRVELDFEDLKRGAGSLGAAGQLDKACKRRRERFAKLKKRSMDIVQYQSPEWALASMHKTGEIYEQLAKELRAGPCAHAADAAPVSEKAVQAYRLTVKMGRELKLDTAAVRAAREALQTLTP